MAHFKELPDATLAAVAAQIGSLFKAEDVLGAAPGELAVHETVEVWMLEATAMIQPTNDLRRLAKRTGSWHHQVKMRSEPAAIARSSAFGPAATDWSVKAFFESKLAAKIDTAIGWIELHVQSDPEVRLLVIPAFQILMFWMLEGESQQVFVVDMPDNQRSLARNTLYSSKELLDAMRQSPVIDGII